jgi:glucosylceramidase
MPTSYPNGRDPLSSRTRLLPPWAVLAVVLLTLPASGQTVQSFVTSQTGDRLAAKPSLSFRRTVAGDSAFHVDEKTRDQEIVGFGASFLESGLISLNALEPPRQEEVLQALFNPDKGAGFSAMKTVIGATDFMAAGPFYTYDDNPGDTALKLFSIRRDLGPNGLVTFIRRAQRHGHFVLQAPMDYPPDWMLIDAKKNQDVDTRYFDALAHYYLHYVRDYEQQGLFVDFISLFNEPRIYTKISPEKIRDLLTNHVGPLFARESVKSRIMACEPNTRRRAEEYWRVILDDPQARRYAGAIAYHAYEYRDFDKIAALHHRYPDLKLWMTEVCHAYETGLVPKSVVLPRRDYEDGDFWGNQIFNDIESGASAWIYWNMILDQRGGPWLVSDVHGDPDPNVQHPVVIVDVDKKEVFYTGLYYYLAHFSKFVRPGSVRVGVTGSMDGVRCLAFQTGNHGMVAQLLNSRKQPAKVEVEWHGAVLALELPALSIATYLWSAPPRQAANHHRSRGAGRALITHTSP